MDFCKELVIHYVPGHVDLIGNELVDKLAKHAANFYTNKQQNEICTSLSNLKSYLKQKLLEQCNDHMNNDLQPGFRQSLL